MKAAELFRRAGGQRGDRQQNQQPVCHASHCCSRGPLGSRRSVPYRIDLRQARRAAPEAMSATAPERGTSTRFHAYIRHVSCMEPQMSFESALGSLLRPIRAGESRLAWNDPRLATAAAFALTSPAFEDGAMMAARSAGDGVGDNVSPRSNGPASRPARRSSRSSYRIPRAPAPPSHPSDRLRLRPEAGGVAEGAFEAGPRGAIRFGPRIVRAPRLSRSPTGRGSRSPPLRLPDVRAVQAAPFRFASPISRASSPRWPARSSPVASSSGGFERR